VSLLRLLLPLLPTLLNLLSEAPQAPRQLARRLALRAALILIPVALLLVGAGFAVAAAYLALAEALSPAAAAAIVALVMCLLAGLEAAVVIAMDRAATRQRAQSARNGRAELLAPLQEVGRLIEAKPLSSVLVAAAAGAVVAVLTRRR
jgi:hypothetical protein